MGLQSYKRKRNFKTTPEPTGGRAPMRGLRFVVQLHDATRLHYDFRLEIEGALKSWAVPKGPSTDPSMMRLAVHVEDHPMDYRRFEGVIPSGYGAGTVIVWDEGVYTPATPVAKDKPSQDKQMQKQLRDGKLHILLHGKKLKGEYALVRTSDDERHWLLRKLKDDYASEKDIARLNKSVRSGKTLSQMEMNNSPKVKKSARAASPKKKRSQAKNLSRIR